MEKVANDRAGGGITQTLLGVAAALFLATALGVSGPAQAARGGGFGGGFHGGAGFHGGGFHGARGGFHGGGFHAGRFASGGKHGGFAHAHARFGGANGGRWVHGLYDGGDGWWWGDGLGWTYSPVYGEYGDYNLPSASPYWYCSDPPGYYPYLTQCNTAWQTAPGS
jgi:hypothetical protein